MTVPESTAPAPAGDARLARTDEDIAALLEWIEVPVDDFRDKYLDDPMQTSLKRKEP